MQPSAILYNAWLRPFELPGENCDAPLMLMGISLVPFTSALVAEYVNHAASANQRVAAAVYGGWFLLIAVFFNLVWRRAARGRRLIGRDVAQQQVDAIHEQYRFGPLFYLGATVLSLLSIPVGLFAYIAIAVYFMLPGNVGATSDD